MLVLFAMMTISGELVEVVVSAPALSNKLCPTCARCGLVRQMGSEILRSTKERLIPDGLQVWPLATLQLRHIVYLLRERLLRERLPRVLAVTLLMSRSCFISRAAF